MIEELHIFGVYVPAALAWAVLSGWLVYGLRNPLQRLPLQRWTLSPALLELCLFLVVWLGLTALADATSKMWLA